MRQYTFEETLEAAQEVVKNLAAHPEATKQDGNTCTVIRQMLGRIAKRHDSAKKAAQAQNYGKRMHDGQQVGRGGAW